MSDVIPLPTAAPAPVVNPKRRGSKARRMQWLSRKDKRQQPAQVSTDKTAMDKVLPALRLAQRFLTSLRVAPADLTEAECAIIEEAFISGLAQVMDSRQGPA